MTTDNVPESDLTETFNLVHDVIMAQAEKTGHDKGEFYDEFFVFFQNN